MLSQLAWESTTPLCVSCRLCEHFKDSFEMRYVDESHYDATSLVRFESLTV